VDSCGWPNTMENRLENNWEKTGKLQVRNRGRRKQEGVTVKPVVLFPEKGLPQRELWNADCEGDSKTAQARF
jgi:hypothetical protein